MLHYLPHDGIILVASTALLITMYKILPQAGIHTEKKLTIQRVLTRLTFTDDPIEVIKDIEVQNTLNYSIC